MRYWVETELLPLRGEVGEGQGGIIGGGDQDGEGGQDVKRIHFFKVDKKGRERKLRVVAWKFGELSAFSEDPFFHFHMIQCYLLTFVGTKHTCGTHTWVQEKYLQNKINNNNGDDDDNKQHQQQQKLDN